MRKSFIFIVLLLLLAGATVFYFGWVQFAVPPSQYGVMQSKTGAVDSELIQNGEFRWAWERLLPTNVNLYLFSIETMQLDVELSHELPSADTYADFAGTQGDFSYDVEASLSFMLDPVQLPVLVRDRGIETQDDLQQYLDIKSDELTVAVLAALQDTIENNEAATASFGSELNAKIQNKLQESFPDLKNIQVHIRNVSYPDLALYLRLKDLYTQYLDELTIRFSPLIDNQVEKTSELRHRIDELSKYGELLSKYPVLLEYMNFEAQNEQ